MSFSSRTSRERVGRKEWNVDRLIRLNYSKRGSMTFGRTRAPRIILIDYNLNTSRRRCCQRALLLIRVEKLARTPCSLYCEWHKTYRDQRILWLRNVSQQHWQMILSNVLQDGTFCRRSFYFSGYITNNPRFFRSHFSAVRYAGSLISHVIWLKCSGEIKKMCSDCSFWSFQ